MLRAHLTTLFLLLAVSGCGFKGPLTLPPAETQQQPPAPAGQSAAPANTPEQK